jgi:hypothetical protein
LSPARKFAAAAFLPLAFLTLLALAVIFHEPPTAEQLAIAEKARALPTPEEARESSTEELSGQSSGKSDIAEFRQVALGIDSKRRFIVGVNEGLTPDYLKITVGNDWHYEPYQMRLQMAQAIWKAWAVIHSPNDLDKSRLQLVDGMDNEVGGSRVFGGSMIWVDD